jgi:hypothetical protein
LGRHGRYLYKAGSPDGIGKFCIVPIKELHKMTQAQARREFSVAGLSWLETREFLPQQRFMVFSRRTGPQARGSGISMGIHGQVRESPGERHERQQRQRA